MPDCGYFERRRRFGRVLNPVNDSRRSQKQYDDDQKGNDRPRKLYRVTGEGSRALAATHKAVSSMWEGLKVPGV